MFLVRCIEKEGSKEVNSSESTAVRPATPRRLEGGGGAKPRPLDDLLTFPAKKDVDREAQPRIETLFSQSRMNIPVCQLEIKRGSENQTIVKMTRRFHFLSLS